jgi:O-antigen/teichoic acid export membrane protein
LSVIKKFAGQTAIYGVSTVASRVLNFFLTPIYVKVYPAGVYGIFTEMYSFASILNALLSFGMETTFFRYLNNNQYKKESIYSNTFLVIGFISLLFLIVSFTFLSPIAEWLQHGRRTSLADYETFIKLFIFILVTDALSVVPFAKLRADGKPGRYSVLKTINIFTFICLNLVFIFALPFIISHKLSFASFFATWYRPHWIGYVFISNLVASLITLILLLPELLQLNFKFDKKLISSMFNYSWPVLVANLSFIINENSDKIFLTHLLPTYISHVQVGIYGACCKLAIFLSIFIQAFRLGAEPFFFNHAKEKNSGTTYALIMDYFIIAISLIFVGLVANIEILKFFIKAQDPVQRELYWSGLKVVPILLFGYVSLGIYMNLSVWYKLSDQTKYGLYISGVGALLTIILNIVYIPQYGFIASAWISLLAYTSMMVMSYFLGQKHYPIPYHILKNIAYMGSSVLLVLLSFIVFKRNLLVGNSLFLMFILFTLYFERNNLKRIIKYDR